MYSIGFARQMVQLRERLADWVSGLQSLDIWSSYMVETHLRKAKARIKAQPLSLNFRWCNRWTTCSILCTLRHREYRLPRAINQQPVSYTHLRAHETPE